MTSFWKSSYLSARSRGLSVCRASSRRVSAALLSYRDRLRPGSFFCEECHKLKGSGSMLHCSEKQRFIIPILYYLLKFRRRQYFDINLCAKCFPLFFYYFSNFREFGPS